MIQSTTFVTAEEIRNKTVQGTFRKYTYFNKGFPNYVYCHSDANFLSLITHWNNIAQQSWYKEMCYHYTYRDPHGEEILLKDIPEDQNFKLKVYLHDQDINYIQ